MPSQKTRSKEDTWTPDELNKALKTGERRHHRDRDEDRKREKVIGDDKHRRRKDDDSDRHRTRDDEDRRRRRKEEEENGSTRLTEDDRERQRRERRERREKDAHPKKGELTFRNKSEGKHIDLQEVDDSPDERHRRHKDDRERRSKDSKGHRDRDEDRDKRHRDRDDRHGDAKRDDKRERRRRDEEDSEVDRERRRIERRKERETKEEAERRRRHEEKKERKRLEEENEKKRDRDDRSDKHRDRREKDRDRDRDERRKEKEREERRREREDRHKDKESKSKSELEKKQVQEEKKEEEEEDEYNYEEDFEDYEEDFEDDDDDDDDDANENNVQGSIHRETKRGTELDYSDSEVNAVLKALDAENDRLIRESSKSPKFSNTRRGDSDDDSDDKYERSHQTRARPRTAINFVSAKQRAMNSKTANKTRQRGTDLLKMLELDYISFDILDMPPVNEYDLYIRAFGGTNTRQAYVQTNDDNVDRDLQTEEIDARQKWTQHPAEDFAGCGRGDGEKDFDEEEESQAKQNKQQDTARLNTFLEKAGQMIAILLEEGKDDEGEQLGKRQSHIAISEGYTELDLLPILAGRHVVSSHFSPVQPNLLLTVYSQAAEISADNPVSKRGIICVWNTSQPTYPQKILACASQPRCCCFSPVKPSLVFAGMQDGSIAMWDLREASSLHCPTVINDQSYSLRYPTYDTAAVLSEENHHSPVTCINPIYSYINSSKSGSTNGSQSSSAPEESTSGLSFQLVSTEETGTLHFWVVAELGTLDMSGSINDLGLAPGGKVKLIKSSALSPESSNNQSDDIDSRLKVGGMKALDMKLLPADPNQYYIATDSGCVLHGVRFGKRAYPRAHSPVIECIVDVLSIDFSPFEKPCFLAGCSDGSFSIYHTKSANPLITWPAVTKGNAVLFVSWSRSRPCVFYILDSSSTLYVFDLLEGDTGPKMTEQVSKDRVSNFSMTNDYKSSGLGTPGKNPQILFGLENGKTEIHTVTKTLREPEDLEADFLSSYLQRF